MSNDAGSVGSGSGGLNLNYNITSSSQSPAMINLGGVNNSTSVGASRLPLSPSSSGEGGGGMGQLLGAGGGLQGAPIVGLNMNNNINLNPLGGMAIGPSSTPQPTQGLASVPGTPGGNNTNNDPMAELHLLVLQLVNQDQREGVLLELSKKRESFPDLAPILWHTVGTVAALLQEIVSIYPLLTPPTLTAHASNRVCNALALLQCVASHPDTRGLFLHAHVPLYLYPFLNTQSKSRPFEYLRLTSLGVIGALVKMDDADVINFLLQTEIIPLCLRIMEAGSELSKTVATFIVQKILLDDVGLGYVCATAERFFAVSSVLNNMVASLVLSPSVRLLKHIVRCYLRLSDNTRARDALRNSLPSSLRDDTFGNALRDDQTVKKWLAQLLSVVGQPDAPGAGQATTALQPPGALHTLIGAGGADSVMDI